jgi:alpha-aminoadipic semialdehyde synthase
MPMIGIRREDKNRWERRAPVTPSHVRRLIAATGVPFVVQPSNLRVFRDEEYRAAGASVQEDLSGCRLVLGVKEIPPERIAPGTAYLIFPHVTKGQTGTREMLHGFLERGCTLLDYELITDRMGRRLIYFGRFAGYAGMIETLWALGQRLRREGIETPLGEVSRAHEYDGLGEARDHLRRVGRQLEAGGLPAAVRPIAVGFTGSGHVFEGAREILHLLPVRETDPGDLAALVEAGGDAPSFLEVDFRREQRYHRVAGGAFDAEEFREHPERYGSALEAHLPHLTVLLHGAFWEPPQPRLVTRGALRSLWSGRRRPRLRVISDISCDIGGGIEATVRATDPGEPVFVYDVHTEEAHPGIDGEGPVVLAVDNLPCELPREASEAFSNYLVPFLPDLIRCDWERPLEDLPLPLQLRRAIIVHRGRLVPRFEGLAGTLEPA